MHIYEDQVLFRPFITEKINTIYDRLGEEHSDYTGIMMSEFLELFRPPVKVSKAAISRNNRRPRRTRQRDIQFIELREYRTGYAPTHSTATAFSLGNHVVLSISCLSHARRVGCILLSHRQVYWPEFTC